MNKYRIHSIVLGIVLLIPLYHSYTKNDGSITDIIIFGLFGVTIISVALALWYAE